ncbi:uncharacterized protein LOC144180695 isoform X2 [Haemaphysalis longicornis]
MEDGSWRHRNLACPPGTAFDSDKGLCWLKKGPCEHGADGQEKPASIQPTEPKTTDTPSKHNPKAKAGKSSLYIENLKKYPGRKGEQATTEAGCPSNFGYFPVVESQCRQYYVCLNVGERMTLKHIFDCPELKRFDPLKMTCVEFSKVSPCQFPATAKHKTIVTDQELINMTSFSDQGNQIMSDLLSPNGTMQALDRAAANFIMSYVHTGRNLTEGETASIQKLLAETQPMPLTVLAASNMITAGLHRVTNSSGVLKTIARLNEDGFFQPDLINHGRSVMKNLTALVQRSGAIQALRNVTSYERFRNAFDSLRRNWMVPRRQGARAPARASERLFTSKQIAALNTLIDRTKLIYGAFKEQRRHGLAKREKSARLASHLRERLATLTAPTSKSPKGPEDSTRRSQDSITSKSVSSVQQPARHVVLRPAGFRRPQSDPNALKRKQAPSSAVAPRSGSVSSDVRETAGPNTHDEDYARFYANLFREVRQPTNSELYVPDYGLPTWR